MTRALAATALALSAPLACSSPRHGDDVGAAKIALTNVPTDVSCVRIDAVGARSQRSDFDVTPGQTSVVIVNGLPTGQVRFFGNAYPSACKAIPAGSEPTWVGDPVDATIAPGAVATVTLPLRRNGRSLVTIDFQIDPTTGEPCVGDQPGCLSPADATGGAGATPPPTARLVSGAEFGQRLTAGTLNLRGPALEQRFAAGNQVTVTNGRMLLSGALANNPDRLARLLGPLPDSDRLRRQPDGNYVLRLDPDDLGVVKEVVTMGEDFASAQAGSSLARFATQDNQLGMYAMFYASVPADYRARNQLPDPAQLAQAPAEQILKLNQSLASQAAVFGGILALDLPPPGFPASCAMEEGTPAMPTDQTGSCKPSSTGIFGAHRFPLKWDTTCVKDQGGRGTCAAFGLTGAIEASIAAKFNHWMNLSEERAYYYAKVPEPCADGLWPFPTLGNMASTKFAFPFERDWDYNPHHGSYTGGSPLCYVNTCVGYGGEHCSGTAHQGDLVCASFGGYLYCGWDGGAPGSSGHGVTAAYELFDFGKVGGSAIGRLALALKTPLVLSTEVPPSFTGAPASGVVTYVGPSEPSYGLHAMTVVGFVENTQLPAGVAPGAGGGYFIVKNSWGSCWKDGGFIYLPYQWVDDYAVSLVSTGAN